MIDCCKKEDTLQQLRYHLFNQTHFLAQLHTYVNAAGLTRNAYSQPCQLEITCLSSLYSRFNFISSSYCSLFLMSVSDTNHEWLLRIFGQALDCYLGKTLPDIKLSREWIRFQYLGQCYLCHRSDLVTVNTSCPVCLLFLRHYSLLDRSVPWDTGFTLSFG